MDTVIKKFLSFFAVSVQNLMYLITRIISIFLVITIQLIRPMLGPSNICPYTIGCTPFAIDQLSTQPLHSACINIFKRLIQCHPFGNRKL